MQKNGTFMTHPFFITLIFKTTKRISIKTSEIHSHRIHIYNIQKFYFFLTCNLLNLQFVFWP